MKVTPLSPEEISEKYLTDLETTKKAIHSISRQAAFLLTISGKIASGKDTVAPLIMNNMGYPNHIKLSFADGLKEEMSQIVSIIQGSPSQEISIEKIKHSLNPKETEYLPLIVNALFEPVKNGEIVDGFSRHVDFRRAIQAWVTDTRRKEDPKYWVKILINSTMNTLAQGTSVYITDGRFPNEIESAIHAHSKLARLNVSKEVQIERLKTRDGIIPDPHTFMHPSEVALDDYPFKIAVSVDKNSPEEIAKEIADQI